MPRFLLSLLAASSLAFSSSGCSAPSASPPQTGGAASEPKGGVGEIAGPYQVPDGKWPQWAHPYPKPGYI